MNEVVNPYSWKKVSLTHFYGSARESLVSELSQGGAGGDSYALVGGRRIGKTTLLRKLAEELNSDKRVQAVYIDAQAGSLLSSPDDLFRWFAAEAEACRDSRVSDYTNFGAWIKQFTIETGIVRVVFLIDEFDVFQEFDWNRIAYNNLRHIIHNAPGISELISFVLAGARGMEVIAEDAGSPLSNVLTWRQVPLLTEADTNRLVLEPSGGLFDDGVSSRVYELTGGHPFLAQYLLWFLFRANTEVTDDTISSACAALFTDCEVVLRRWWFDHLNADERAVFRMLRANRAPTGVEAINGSRDPRHALKVLEYTGLVRRNDGGWAQAGSLFSSWLDKYDVPANDADQILPTAPTSSLGGLFDQVEQMMRAATRSVVSDKWGAQWYSTVRKVHRGIYDKACETYEKRHSGKEGCPEGEFWDYTDFASPFEVLMSHWSEAYRFFGYLSPDKNKAKMRFEERKDVLVPIRNDIRHSRRISETQRDRARVYCNEIINGLADAGVELPSEAT